MARKGHDAATCQHCEKLRRFGQCCKGFCLCRLTFVEDQRATARDAILSGHQARVRQQLREQGTREGNW